MDEITDHCVVVTGATGGMGAAIARAFATEGRALLLCDLHADRLEALADSLQAKTPVTILAADITASDFPAQLLKTLERRKIAVLAHAAGVSPSMADGRRIFEINLHATIRLTEAALPLMAQGGAAILIASNSGHLAGRPIIDRILWKSIKGKNPLLLKLMLRNPGIAYGASKRAVQLYARHMSGAFGKVGARIVSLSPGIIDTDMAALENKSSPQMEKMVEVSSASRMGKADEIASVVTFLASPAASYISGTDILVDGGTIAGVEHAGGVMRLMRG